jgi:hypothetical protein
MKHTLAVHRLLALIAGLVAAACGADGQDAAELESVTEPITGGGLPSSPFSSVVYYNNHCTATKIGPRTFLTAGHCLDGLISASNPNPTLTMTKAADGVSDIVSVGLVHAYHHPSRVSLMIQSPQWQSHYDAAVLEVDSDTPTFATSPVNSIRFADGFQGNLLGYGCDETNPSHSGKKQNATISAITLHDMLVDYPSQPVDYLADVYAHFVQFENTSGISLCPGDSGGPTFRNSNNAVAGISSSRDTSPATGRVISHITRTGNIREWILNPVENSFQVGSGGFFLNAWAGKCVGDYSSGVLSTFCSAPSQTTDVQYWTLGTHPAFGYFEIVNGNTGECLTRLANNGTDTRACTGIAAQAWRFNELAAYPPFSVPGQQSTFKYYGVENGTGWCLTPDGSQAQATAIVTQPCSNTTAQSWVFTQ